MGQSIKDVGIFWSFLIPPPLPCRNFDPDLTNFYLLISCNIGISDPPPPKICGRLFLWMALYVLIKRGTFINFFILYLLNIFLFTFCPSAMYKKIILFYKRGLCLFKELCFFGFFAKYSKGYVNSRGYVYSGVLP